MLADYEILCRHSSMKDVFSFVSPTTSSDALCQIHVHVGIFSIPLKVVSFDEAADALLDVRRLQHVWHAP